MLVNNFVSMSAMDCASTSRVPGERLFQKASSETFRVAASSNATPSCPIRSLLRQNQVFTHAALLLLHTQFLIAPSLAAAVNAAAAAFFAPLAFFFGII